jgi:hypothetical protein
VGDHHRLPALRTSQEHQVADFSADTRAMPFDPSHLWTVSREDVERIFESFSLSEIAEAWCAYTVTKDDRYWWAVDLMWSEPYLSDRARREKLIELLIETAPNDDVLGGAAAGPLEDAIYDADECVSWLQARAATSPRFRMALGRVWIWNQVSAERFAQIERAAGRSLPRPR